MQIEDLPESTIQRMIDYTAASTNLLRTGRHDFRIPFIVVDEWARKGQCVLSTNRLARDFKSTRRTICASIRRLLEAGVIREIDRTSDGRPVFEPCLEIGDKWRAAKEARVNDTH
jgi:hypothetical protein